MAIADKPETTREKKKYKVIGTRPIRHDGVDKVNGRAKYGADIKLTGMLYGAMLRSPHAHAKIKKIDTSKAEALPGVRAVCSSADMPDQGDRIVHLGEGAANMKHVACKILARDKVLYRGHAVAAVAADNVHIAGEAVKLIEVEYEVLPPVTSVLQGMADDAPILHDDIRTQTIGAEDPGAADKKTNIAKHFNFEKGDVEKGFAESDLVIEREFDTTMAHQGYIEPHTATSLWSPDGKITVYTSTQGSFTARQQTAELLRVPLSSVRVIPMEIGGGFGGKIGVYLEPVAAILSRKSGRPVKITMSRTDVFEATGPTPGSHMKVKIGVKKDGSIVAGEAWIAFEAGAFTGSPVGAGCMCVFSCYDFPNGRVEGFDVLVNKPKTEAYRAPGSTQVAFATETIVDEICQQLDIDPIEFRLKNGATKGTRRVDGPAYNTIGMIDTVQAIQNSDHYKSSLDGKFQGRGVATGFWFNVGMKSTLNATVNGDGTVSLQEGNTDIGGTRTSIAMQLAETLGIAAEDVHPTVVDTDSIGHNDVTAGSRITFTSGIAAYECGLDIRNQLVERAAILWECEADQVTYEDGAVKGPDGKSMPFKEIAAKVTRTGGPITGTGTSSGAAQSGAFGTHCVDVEVDPELGKVQILRYTIAQDAGTAIHPSYVEGQMQGGVVQGIGWALNEEYYYDDDGMMANPTYLDYRMPTCYDVPMIDTIIVEVPDPNHPYGVRGVGEVPIVPPPAAIANAIANAVGVRMTELPMSPPKLWAKISEKDS